MVNDQRRRDRVLQRPAARPRLRAATHERQAQVGAAVAHIQLHLVQHALNALARKPVLQRSAQTSANGGLALRHVLVVAQPGRAQRKAAGGGVQAGGRCVIGRQTRVNERSVYGRLRAVEQQRRQHTGLGALAFGPLTRAGDHPRARRRQPGVARAVRGQVNRARRAWRRVCGLGGLCRLQARRVGKPVERELGKERASAVERDVAVGDEEGVVRCVVAGVEVDEAAVRERGDGRWVAARHKAQRRGAKQQPL